MHGAARVSWFACRLARPAAAPRLSLGVVHGQHRHIPAGAWVRDPRRQALQRRRQPRPRDPLLPRPHGNRPHGRTARPGEHGAGDELRHPPRQAQQRRGRDAPRLHQGARRVGALRLGTAQERLRRARRRERHAVLGPRDRASGRNELRLLPRHRQLLRGLEGGLHHGLPGDALPGGGGSLPRPHHAPDQALPRRRPLQGRDPRRVRSPQVQPPQAHARHRGLQQRRPRPAHRRGGPRGLRQGRVQAHAHRAHVRRLRPGLPAQPTKQDRPLERGGHHAARQLLLAGRG